MKTPAGVECPYFYGDYHRGRNQEECRLLKNAHPPLEWQPSLCSSCPVPGIKRANTCEHMNLIPEVIRPFLILKPRVRVQAYCTKTEETVKEPRIGCGKCHQIPDVFLQE